MANGAPTVSNGLVISGVTTSTNVSVASSVTATTYYGSGANLTNITQTTINNNADNRVITGSNTSNTLEGESNVVINGGKLGIGVASPAQLIEVHGASNPAVLVQDTTNNCISYMYSQDSVATFGSASNHPVVFNVNNGEKARIDTSGNLLIGTTTAGTGSGDDLTISNSSNMGLTLRSTSSNYCNIYFSDATSGTATYEGYISYNHATDSLEFATVHTERLRIDSSGRLLLGTTSRGQDDADNLTIDGSGEGTGRTGLTIRSATNTFGSIFFSDATSGAGQYDGVVAYDHSTQMMRFSTASTQRVFINSSGQLLVATSSATSLGSHTGASNVSTFNQSGITLTQYGVTAGFYYDRLNFTNSQYFIVNASNTGVYLGNGATSWTGYSDERMKTNITELDGTKAYNHIKTARATSFKWNATGYPTDTKIGFIAQDWETNYPEVVNSTTETIDSVENPKGIQYTETVPVLMAALKQAITKIETLEQENIALRVRVTNLEGN